jgi:Protein of unknown function (DUF2793)
VNRTARHLMPLLASGQAQKEVTHNEALQMIDRRLQLAVISRSVSAPPSPAVSGAIYIVPAEATGEWSGQTDRIASYDGFGWTFDAPQPGWLVWIIDEAVMSIFDGKWSDGYWPVTALRIGGRQVLGGPLATIANPSGGLAIDVESRLAIDQILAMLRGHGLIQ